MKKIGFIDNFLSEAHANTYPDKIRNHEIAREAGLEVCYAYSHTEVSPYDNVTTAEWCAKNKVERILSIEELVDKSDLIMILSPDNPELHEQLAYCALKSGKPTYIDKTFAPDKQAAIRMFELAKKYHTPMWSTSALRFADEIRTIMHGQAGAKSTICTGPYLFDIYAIHIFEMMVSVMKSGAKRMMAVSNTLNRSIVVDYGDRKAIFNQIQAPESDFEISIEQNDGKNNFYRITSNYFDNFIHELIQFFITKKIPVESHETIDLMGMLVAARQALMNPFVWIEI